MDRRFNILGVDFDCLDRHQAQQAIAALVDHGGVHQVITANAEMVMASRKDARLQAVFRQAKLVVADGVGVILASRMLGRPLPQRVAGVDLTAELLRCAAKQGWPVYLFGARPEVMAALERRCRALYPDLRLAGTQHGFVTERSQVAQDIARSRARLLLVGLGAPAQEHFIFDHAHLWQDLVALGVGGSFDILSAHKARAPGWMQRYGLEWLYRLLREPRRYRRQLALPAFFLLVLKTRWFKGKR